MTSKQAQKAATATHFRGYSKHNQMFLIDTTVNPLLHSWFRRRGIRGISLRSLLFASLAFATPSIAGLLERSPFIPHDFDPSTPSERRAQAAADKPLHELLEFRGFYVLNGEYRFLIKEKDKPAGRWVRLDDASAEFVVRQFDPGSKTVQLEFGGNSGSIELVRLSSDGPMAVSAEAGYRGASPTASTSSGSRGTTTASTARTQSGGNQSGTTRRRTPPPPPQWVQSRLASAGIDPAEVNRAIAAGPPQMDVPPPPNFTPPPPPNIDVAGGVDRGNRPNLPSRPPSPPPTSTPPTAPPSATPPSLPPRN